LACHTQRPRKDATAYPNHITLIDYLDYQQPYCGDQGIGYAFLLWNDTTVQLTNIHVAYHGQRLGSALLTLVALIAAQHGITHRVARIPSTAPAFVAAWLARYGWECQQEDGSETLGN
jgi:hypothetical protein